MASWPNAGFSENSRIPAPVIHPWSSTFMNPETSFSTTSLGCDDNPLPWPGYLQNHAGPKWNPSRFAERRLGEKTVAQIEKLDTTLFGSPDLMWWSSRYGNTALCQYMLGLDERVHQLGRMAGVSGLHMATLWNHDDIIRLYVESRQDIDVPDDHGLTAAFWATAVGSRNCMTELRRAGCNIGATTKWQLCSEIVAEINTGISRSRNWFDVSCFETNLLLLGRFQQEGMTNNQEVQFLKDLMLWILSGQRDFTDLKLYKMLLEHGADPTHLIFVTSAFHRAARFGHEDVLQLFLDWGVYVNITDRLGWTGLHYATFRDHEDSVHLLTRNLADPTVDTVEGNPVTVAHVYERCKIVRHLQSYQDNFVRVLSEHSFRPSLCCRGEPIYHQQSASKKQNLKKQSFLAEDCSFVFQGSTVYMCCQHFI